MRFVRTYAKIAIFLALTEIACSLVGLKFPEAMDLPFVVLAAVRALWLIVSLGALLFFPAYDVPIASPLLYVLFAIASVFLTLAAGNNWGFHDSEDWVNSTRRAHALLYQGYIAAAVLYFALNVRLLLLKRPLTAQPDPVASSQAEPAPLTPVDAAAAAAANPEPQPAVAAAEPEPLPAAADEPEPAPAAGDEPEPAPAAADEPEPAAADEPEPAPAAADEPEPADPAESELSTAAAPDAEDAPVTLKIPQHEEDKCPT